MTFLAQLSLIFRIDGLIRRKSTGTASHLAQKLNTSRSSVYRYLDLLRNLGATIEYCHQRQSYFYTEAFELDLNGVVA
ncbi:MAG: HTH domain-containing protein [Saprospiraceae bacterium]